MREPDYYRLTQKWTHVADSDLQAARNTHEELYGNKFDNSTLLSLDFVARFGLL